MALTLIHSSSWFFICYWDILCAVLRVGREALTGPERDRPGGLDAAAYLNRLARVRPDLARLHARKAPLERGCCRQRLDGLVGIPTARFENLSRELLPRSTNKARRANRMPKLMRRDRRAAENVCLLKQGRNDESSYDNVTERFLAGLGNECD